MVRRAAVWQRRGFVSDGDRREEPASG
jgi:hypothetical protein